VTTAQYCSSSHETRTHCSKTKNQPRPHRNDPTTMHELSVPACQVGAERRPGRPGSTRAAVIAVCPPAAPATRSSSDVMLPLPFPPAFNPLPHRRISHRPGRRCLRGPGEGHSYSMSSPKPPLKRMRWLIDCGLITSPLWTLASYRHRPFIARTRTVITDDRDLHVPHSIQDPLFDTPNACKRRERASDNNNKPDSRRSGLFIGEC
jgi:hypothetical protein